MRVRRRQIQTTNNTTPAATFPQAAAMAYSASLQSFLPPSAHAAMSSSQHRPNRARPFQCAAVSAPSAAAASPSASAVPAARLKPRVEQRCNRRAGTGCLTSSPSCPWSRSMPTSSPSRTSTCGSSGSASSTAASSSVCPCSVKVLRHHLVEESC
ncbi:uncharacterized protein [Triticum aestivum]|uniref:uncharacterized protein n=1 Tax=Triticum aestivum TaxID=4565 RepID=UPI001D02F27F|nr:uncharacterized protein LOC123169599 [Triticum aestivum]XP_044443405.1 uncharacterized protein LOC123169599 [Triticum aestivum]XP_044443406.1 uncharacterized protein LOC123169599 [Triticum aestivum]